MRDFIRILTEAEMNPLLREDLLEEVIADPVGYWVTSTGKVHPVESLHFQTLSRVGRKSLAEALQAGWVKVSTDGEFAAEFAVGCATSAALRSVAELAIQHNHGPYTMDAQWQGAAQRVIALSENVRERLFEAATVHEFQTAHRLEMGLGQFLLERDAVIPWALEDQALDRAFQNIDWSSGTGEEYRNWYASENDIEDPEDLDENEPNFKRWVKHQLSDRLGDAMWEIEERFSGGMIRCWRVITAPQNWKPDGRHPGIYWSWDKNAAEAHWGDFSNGNVTWRMEALIRSDQIDWLATLAANADPTLGEEEKEIRLKGEVPVELVGAERVGR